MTTPFHLEPISECHLMIRVGEKQDECIDTGLSPIIHHLCHRITAELEPVLMNMTPSYHSILIDYLPYRISEQALIEKLHRIISQSLTNPPNEQPENIIQLPCFYDPRVGFDIERYEQKGMSLPELIEHHTHTIYTVCAIGFAPGFAFMANVPNEIQLPRLASPRMAVPKGSVAIANEQTAIYPRESAAGWNIIGNCPLEMTQLEKGTLSLTLNVGDQVQFKEIDEMTFIELGGVMNSDCGTKHHNEGGLL